MKGHWKLDSQGNRLQWIPAPIEAPKREPIVTWYEALVILFVVLSFILAGSLDKWAGLK